MMMPKAGSQSRVGIHTKGATMSPYHFVHWGELGATYNRNFKRFRLMSRAKDFAKRISKTGKYDIIS